MKSDKIYALLGLAARGRNLVSGEFASENAVKDGSAVLVIVAQDASNNTKKLFTDKCSYYEVPCVMYGTKGELGHCIGKEERASVAVVDEGLARAIMRHLDESQN